MSTKSYDMPVAISNHIKVFAKFFFYGGAALTLFFPLVMKNLTIDNYLKYAFLNGFAFAVFGYGNGILAEWIDGFLPWTGKNTALRLAVSILATVVYTSIAWLFVVWMWVLFDEGRIIGWLEFLRIIPRNKTGFWVTQGITFFVSAFMHGRTFLIGWRKSIVEAERLKKEHIAAQYETLKNQVNPHFLFNSFNVLTTLVHKDADLAEQFVRQLSNVYRYVLDSRDKEVVPLAEELHQLEAYVFLMKIRFGESLKVDLADITTDGKVIAPLTLQMLMENALKHNIVSKSTPLSISVFQEDNYIVIKNKLQIKNSIGESTGVGLENIKSRYKFLTDKEIIVLQEDNYFIVKIPIMHQNI